MWWGAFTRRHQVLSFAHGGHASSSASPVSRATGERGTGDARKRRLAELRAPGRCSPSRARAWRTGRPSVPRPPASGRRRTPRSRWAARSSIDHRDASARLRRLRRSRQLSASARNSSASGASTAGALIRRHASGARTGASRPAHRRRDRALSAGTERGRQLTSDGERCGAPGEGSSRPQQADERARFLDAQAALPAGAQARGREPASGATTPRSPPWRGMGARSTSGSIRAPPGGTRGRSTASWPCAGS
jgi:hypothetical protein